MIDAIQKQYLKDLAKRVKELSETPHNQAVIKKYKDINSLSITVVSAWNYDNATT